MAETKITVTAEIEMASLEQADEHASIEQPLDAPTQSVDVSLTKSTEQPTPQTFDVAAAEPSDLPPPPSPHSDDRPPPQTSDIPSTQHPDTTLPLPDDVPSPQSHDLPKLLTPDVPASQSNDVSTSDIPDSQSRNISPSKLMAEAPPQPTDVPLNKPLSAEDATRDHWGFNWEFIFAAVSFGTDFWMMHRFSISTYVYGGALYLVPFTICLLITGIPMVYMELCLGQFFGKGPAHIWNFSPLFRGVGVGMVVAMAISVPYNGTVLSWALFYLFQSFSSVLPWSDCNNAWNRDTCHLGVGYSSNNYTVDYIGTSSAEEYFERRVLQIFHSSGIDHLGSLRWELVGCMFGVVILMFAALFWGVKVVGKVVSVTLLVRYISILILLTRMASLPGSLDGIRYFLEMSQPQILLYPSVWKDAFVLALFSNGVGLGAIHNLASYKKFKSSAFRDSCFVGLITAVTCFVAGLVFFAMFGALAHLENQSIDNIAYGTFSFFENTPRLFAMIPGFQFWCFLYFFMMLVSGLPSQCLALDVIITAITDSLPRRTRMIRLIVTAVICVATLVFSLPFLTQGGLYLYMLFNNYTFLLEYWILIILQCITVGWIYGIDQFSNDIHAMTGVRPPVVFKFIWCFLIPLFSLLTLLSFVLENYSPYLRNYEYPVWSIVMGWVIALVPLMPLPVFILMTIVSSGQRSSSPTECRPADPEHRVIYESQVQRTRTCMDRLRDVFRI